MRTIRNRFHARILTIASAAFLLLGLTSAGVAIAAATTHAGTTVTRVSVTTQSSAVNFTSPSWTNVGSLSIVATAGQFLDVTFTAETACSGTSGWCSVRVLVDGAEAEPVVGTDFAFNEAETATSWESHSVERVRTISSSGTHTVVVQTAQVGGTTHRLDDWTLRAMAIAL